MKVIGLSWLIIALIVLSTLVFVVGVTIEHQDDEPGSEDGHDEAQEVEGLKERGNAEESIFGIYLESTPIIISIIIVWVVLIIALVLFGHPVYIIIAIVALLVAIFDIGEVLRKLGENNLIALFAMVSISFSVKAYKT